MNELNTNLIEAAKEKFPAKGQLANILMDTLYMGKEAIYRRLRGEVPFTFQEAAIISKELGISLDRIAGVSFSNNAMFDINVVDHGNPFETYYDFLNKHVKLFHTLREDPNASLGTASNVIPQTLYLKHELLAKFRFFKWMYQNEHIKCKHFEELEIPQKIINVQQDFAKLSHHIQYFSDIHLISDEMKQNLKEELLILTDELERLAIKGKTDFGNDVHIYVSQINFEATYSYLETSTLQLSLIRVYSINSLTTQDVQMFQSLKEWIQSLKKFSTLISESGEMQRIQFFNQQREIIDAL